MILFTSVKNNLRESFSLIRKSFGTWLLFELVYKLVTAFIVIPSAAWIMGKTAQVSGLNFISGENYFKALMSPAIIAELVFFAVVLAFFTMFEISYLTLCFNQSYADKPIAFFRMLKIAGKDSVRLVKPHNHYLIPFIVLMTPFANSAIISSLLSDYTIPSFIISKLTSKGLYLGIVIAVVVIMLLSVIATSQIYIIYCLEDTNGRLSFKESYGMLKGKIKRMMVTCVSSVAVYCAGIFIVAELIYVAFLFLTSLFSSVSRIYAFLLTANTALVDILNFAVPSLMVVCGYSVVCSFYFDLMNETNQPLPRVEVPKIVNAKHRNLRMGIALCCAALVAVIAVSYRDSKSEIAGFNSNQVLVMAHRGASADCPENTLPAFEKAIELQADYIELDVQETSDGYVVVSHDMNTVRCTGTKGLIWKMTLEEVKKLDAGYRYEEYKGTQIPTLEEVFDLCKGKIKLNIEIKYNKHTPQTTKDVADLIEKYEMQDDVVITSSNRTVLKEMKTYLPDVQCGYIISISVGDYYDYEYADFFSIEKTCITTRVLNKCHRLGKGVNAWTVNDEDSMEKMVALGVDSIITDNPLLAKEEITKANDPMQILKYLLQT